MNLIKIVGITYVRYSSTTTSLYHAWTCMVPCNVAGGCFRVRGICVTHLLTLHECGTMQLFYALWWSHDGEAHSSSGNPNCERISFVRQQFHLPWKKVIQVVEWKDLSDVGRTGATPTLLRLVFCIVIVSTSVTHPWQSRKIMWNHMKNL